MLRDIDRGPPCLNGPCDAGCYMLPRIRAKGILPGAPYSIKPRSEPGTMGRCYRRGGACPCNRHASPHSCAENSRSSLRSAESFACPHVEEFTTRRDFDGTPIEGYAGGGFTHSTSPEELSGQIVGGCERLAVIAQRDSQPLEGHHPCRCGGIIVSFCVLRSLCAGGGGCAGGGVFQFLLDAQQNRPNPIPSQSAVLCRRGKGQAPPIVSLRPPQKRWPEGA